jgi:hypothetical protein
MVLWCKICNALIGVAEPITNWTTDRTRVCTICNQKQESELGAKTDLKEREQNDETIMDCAQDETSNPLKLPPSNQ